MVLKGLAEERIQKKNLKRKIINFKSEVIKMESLNQDGGKGIPWTGKFKICVHPINQTTF